MVAMEKKKINFWIKGGSNIHLSYGGIILTQSIKGETDEISDFGDLILVGIHNYCIPKILNGEICGINFLDDPYVLIFIPWGKDITVGLKTELTDFYKPWQEFTIRIEDWCVAVQHATQERIYEIQKSSKEKNQCISDFTLTECYIKTDTLLKTLGYLRNISFFSDFSGGE
jgi:hypothetical protein